MEDTISNMLAMLRATKKAWEQEKFITTCPRHTKLIDTEIASIDTLIYDLQLEKQRQYIDARSSINQSTQ